MIANITGIVTTASIFHPQNGQSGKPYVAIQLLQISGNSSEIVKVKDYDLTSLNSYVPGGEFRRDCIIRAWSMDQRLGISVEVSRGASLQNNFLILSHNIEKNEKTDRPKLAV